MNKSSVSQGRAGLEVLLWNAEAESVASGDLYIWLRESGLPSEVSIRLKSLIEVTAEFADHVINIGKIVLLKIIDFIKEHPNFAIGVALGVAIGLLTGAIPLVGPFLAPITAALGIAVGAVGGHRLDEQAKGKNLSLGVDPITVSLDIIEIAKAFFKLLIDTINAVAESLSLQVVRNV